MDTHYPLGNTHLSVTRMIIGYSSIHLIIHKTKHVPPSNLNNFGVYCTIMQWFEPKNTSEVKREGKAGKSKTLHCNLRI